MLMRGRRRTHGAMCPLHRTCAVLCSLRLVFQCRAIVAASTTSTLRACSAAHLAGVIWFWAALWKCLACQWRGPPSRGALRAGPLGCSVAASSSSSCSPSCPSSPTPVVVVAAGPLARWLVCCAMLRCFLWSAGRAARASRWSRARLERGQVLLCAARASCNNLPLLPSHPPRCRRRLGTSSLSAAAWRWPLARHDVKHDVRHVTGRIAPISGRSLPLGLIGRPVCLSVPCVRPSASMSRLLEAAGERPPQRCVVPHSCSLPFRFISQLCCISIWLQLHCILRAIRAGAAVIIVQPTMAKQRNEGIFFFDRVFRARARASALLRRERERRRREI